MGNYQSAGEGVQSSSYGVQTLSSQNNNSSGSGNSGGGSSFFAGGGSHGSAGSSGISMTNGLSTLSLTTNLNSNVTKQNSTPYTPGTGGTDPGGDPTGGPIPVGDGWVIFVLFGIIYAIIKVFFKGKYLPSEIKTTLK